jgi:hypothetical protein
VARRYPQRPPPDHPPPTTEETRSLSATHSDDRPAGLEALAPRPQPGRRPTTERRNAAETGMRASAPVVG